MSAPANTCFTYSTPHGPLTIRASKRGIVEIAFGPARADEIQKASDITNKAANELQEYLAGKRTAFNVPIDPQGSAFQQEVWECACEVPYGETRTPTDIARAMGKPGAHRSVGTALKMNKLAPLVPTHRITAPNATGKQAKLFRALQALERRTLEQTGTPEK